MNIDKNRLVEKFINLVRIDSPTFNEREIIDYLKKTLEDMDIEYFEDEAYKNTDGNTGNLICKYKGNLNKPKILFMAHVDNVAPCNGINPIIDNDIIKTDKTTVLGGDDLAGVAIILEVLNIIKENEIDTGDIEIVFSVSEEGGLFGAKNMDYSKIDSKYAFVLDGDGDIGTVAIKAPYHNQFEIDVYGKAAHSGIAPQKGIDAIQIASNAIASLEIGRIDKETTSNIGLIKGGRATNIVSDHVWLKGEVRSLDKNKLDNETNKIIKAFEKEAEKKKGRIEKKIELEYSGYDIKENETIIKLLKKAADSTKIELILESTGGGSDTNILNEHNIKAVDMSIGMREVHTVDEYIKISDMYKCTEFVLGIIKEYAKMEVS